MRVLLPMATSVIISVNPKVTARRTYVIRKAPPPYFAARYGNLHIFPSPTAEPAAARTKPIRLVKLLLSFITNAPLYSVF